MRRRPAPEHEDDGLDMTPMLDVVFIMLIFFIVSASFVRESGVEVARPQAETSVIQANTAIIIAIRDNNTIWVNRRQIAPPALRAQIERLRSANPTGGAVITADARADTGILVQVMDALRLAGVDAISIAADPTGK